MNTGATWLRFNLVGVLGFGVQALVLWMLVAVAGVPAPLAITLAVFAAVSHNFAWHERFTWPRSSADGRLKRWIGFNVTTGVLSIAANVVLTGAVVQATGIPVVGANLIAVGLLSIVNFVVSDRVIFSRISPDLAITYDPKTLGNTRVRGADSATQRLHLRPPAHAKTGLISSRT